MTPAPAAIQQAAVLAVVHCHRRLDNSAELAAEARYAFAAGLAKGEAGLQLARQALLIAAEDDAIGIYHIRLVCMFHTLSRLSTSRPSEQPSPQPLCSAL
jgi:hypothetical protein